MSNAMVANSQTSSCSYADTCESSSPCCSNLSFSGYVDYLYWKVNRSDLYLNVGDGKNRYLCPNYDSNFRVGANISCKCIDFGLRYTRLYISKSEDWDLEERAKYKIDFDMLDIEAGYRFTFECINATFRPFAGVKILSVEQKFENDFRDDFDAVGIYTGIETKWQLCEKQICNRSIPISLLFRASTGIVDGKHDYHDDDGKECLYTFVNDIFFGVDCGFSNVGCANANMQIGYEIQNYSNWAEFFGFSGLVVRLGLMY